ncbi:MAG: RHS repeat-associated core domain-containing protein, partial [Candidatus Electrothrix sp. AX1]|nr:RHS repeat-associated core domain-containing protein [Candidatus Electrothrix sp. AX1]
RNREVGSKNVFVGTGRIVTKLVKGQENVTTPGTATHPGKSNPSGKAVGHSGKGNNGGGSGGGAPGKGTILYEPDLFYYHPNHLGSTSFVTDAEGEIYQHLEYFPFGETWIEEVSNQHRVPFLFTAKELDRETGLYYFGARYYDPRTSVWQSTDPILGDYLPTGDKEKDRNLSGMGGVFNSFNLGLYHYSFLRPVTFIDSDGNAPVVGPAIILVGKSIRVVSWTGQGLNILEDILTDGLGVLDDIYVIPELYAIDRMGIMTANLGQMITAAEILFQDNQEGQDTENSNTGEQEPPKNKKVEQSGKGEKVRTPDSNPRDFSKLKNGQGYKNKNTGETWQKSHTNHKGDAWKVRNKAGDRVGSVKPNGEIVGK